MQQTQHNQPVLLFTIRFQNNKPHLAQTQPLNYNANSTTAQTIQHNHVQCLTPPPVLNTTATPFLLMQHSHTAEVLTLPETLMKVASEPARESHSLLTQQQKGTQNIQLSHSLIDELLLISQQEQCLTQGRKTGLEELDILETESLRDEDSDYLQDEHSQIVALTEQEKNFFNNFVVHQPSRRLDDSIFKNVHIVDTHSRVLLKSSRILRQRKKVIRNFFRPKGSFLKEQQTSCNSSSNLQEISDSRRTSLLNDHKPSGKLCSRSQLTHLIIE